MKKMRLFFALAVSVALVAVGCDKSEPEEHPGYIVTVTAGDNGAAEADIEIAPPGTTITLTATPVDEDYMLDKWVVIEGDVVLEDVTATTQEFALPEANVVIRADFKLVRPALNDPSGDVVGSIEGVGKLPAATASYVGAFWKHDQIGERVIKINVGKSPENKGPWSAEVAWYGEGWMPTKGDGVVLAAGGSSDAAIYTANPGDAEDYLLSSASSSVSGTVAADEDIIFRIGLTKRFGAYDASNNPARYAVVVLTYGTPAVKQKIFLRHGEGADYVMRPGDKDGSGNNVGGADDRSLARKFSPYNLTDPNSNTASDYNAMTTPTTGLVGANGGVFVEYPTQGGYFFQYNTAPLAFHPTAPIATFSNWSEDSGVEFWNAANDDTCPEGYRRPQDGNTTVSHNSDGLVAGSEMRQSLWQNPVAGYSAGVTTDNFAWGYYADGYFDRLKVGHSVTDQVDVAVAASSKDAAYIGQLFFNPNATSDGYNASLFMPAAGLRDSGVLVTAGLVGSYWSGASRDSVSACRVFFTRDNNSPYYGSRFNGYSVRCVQK